MERFVLLAFALGGAAACGDNLGVGDDDDTVIDAATIDAAADRCLAGRRVPRRGAGTVHGHR